MSSKYIKLLLTIAFVVGYKQFIYNQRPLNSSLGSEQTNWVKTREGINNNYKLYNREVLDAYLDKALQNNDLLKAAEISNFGFVTAYNHGLWLELNYFLQKAQSILPHLVDPELKRKYYYDYFDYSTKNLWHENDYQKIDSFQKYTIKIIRGWGKLSEIDKYWLGYAYRNLGNNAINRDLTAALGYYNEGKKVDPNSLYTKKKIAEYYSFLNDSAQSFKIYRESINSGIKNTPKNNYNEQLCDILVQFTYEQLKFDDIKGAQQSLSLLDVYKTDNEYNNLQKIYLEGKVHSAKGKYDLANKYLQSFISISERRYGKKKQSSILAIYDLAKNEFATKDYRQSLASIQKALINSSLQFSNADINKIPDPDQIIFKNEAIDLLQLKARSLYALSDYIAAIKSNDLAFKLIERVQSNFQNDEEISSSNNEYKDIYEDQLDYLYVLQKGSDDREIAEQALQVFEMSKNSILLKNYRNSNAMVFGGIPENLIQKESRIKNELTSLEKTIRDQAEGSNFNNTNELLNLISAKKKEYNSIIQDFKIRYPNYFRLKYNYKFVEINDVTSNLEEGKAMVQYFMGERYIYALVINRNKSNFYRLSRTEDVKQRLYDLTYGMELYASKESEYFSKRYDLTYSRLAYKLNNLLIEPIRPSLIGITKMALIVDGELGFLPFDILLTSAVDIDKIPMYKSYPFLLKDFSISYNTSGTLWLEMELSDDKSKNISWTGFAPSYDVTSQSSPYNLVNSSKEIRRLSYELGGSYFVGKNATKKVFLEEVNEKSLVQFAGHCIINDKYPDSSYLAFTDVGSEAKDWKLTVNDIYGIHVSSKYVVLSACETGIGLIKKGEGIMSLSRAFAFAGASSILSTFWKVDDKYSYTLMSELYNYLSKGMTKDEALRNSKLDFIKSVSNAEAHPFNWGSFATIGNTSSIDLEKFTPWWQYLIYISLATGLVAGLWIFFVRWRGEK